MKHFILNILCLFLLLKVGTAQNSIAFPSPSAMRIEVALGVFSPDSLQYSIQAYPNMIHISDYINNLTNTHDVAIFNIEGNSLFSYPYTFNFYDFFYGKFFFDGNSDIGIDTGIILGSGNVLYWPSYYGNNQIGPGLFPGVTWPAKYFSSGPNEGPTNPSPNPNMTDVPRDTQYPELVAMNNGDSVWDANVLDFDFVPKGPYIKLQYVFGSEEYGQTCGYPTDVMGIFLSGPGIVGKKNIAVLPGTNTPVNPMTVYPAHSACRPDDTSASPYYVDNTGGQNIIYDGFTKVMTAYASVTPCDTYHLRIAVADGALHPYDTTFEILGLQDFGTTNLWGPYYDTLWGTKKGRMLYDSGIMLKDHSFRSTDSLWIRALGGSAQSEDYPYAVRGCLNGKIRLHAATPWPLDRSFHLHYGGSAISGTDYSALSTVVTLPAYDTFVDIPVTALSGGSGTKTLEVKLASPYGACYQMNGSYLDSTVLYISDGYLARIEPRDTVICTGCSFTFHIMAEDFMSYSWSPGTGLNNAYTKNPTASPQVNTQYILTATPDALHPCPGSKDSTWVYVGNTGIHPAESNNADLKIYPNPFKDGFSLSIGHADAHRQYDLKIYDLLGKKIVETTGKLKEINHEIKNIGRQLSAGAYLIELKSEQGDVYRGKVEKR